MAEQAVMPLNDLQISMVVAVEEARITRALTPQEIQQLRQRVPSVSHIAAYFQGAGRLPIFS